MRNVLKFGLAVVLVMVLLITGLLCSTSCAPAAQVTFDLTLPLFAADSATCAQAPDTVKNLATLIVYSSTGPAFTDSLLVYQANVGGLYGKPVSFTISQPSWSTRWYRAVTRDSLAHRSCLGNVTSKTVTGGWPKAISDLRAR